MSVHVATPPLQLVQSCAEQYLTSEHRSVRLEAVRTCAALLVPNLLSPNIFHLPSVSFSAASAQVVGDVLGKLLTVGITDPGGWSFMGGGVVSWSGGMVMFRGGACRAGVVVVSLIKGVVIA